MNILCIIIISGTVTILFRTCLACTVCNCHRVVVTAFSVTFSPDSRHGTRYGWERIRYLQRMQLDRLQRQEDSQGGGVIGGKDHREKL